MEPFNSEGDKNVSKATQRMMARANGGLPQKYAPLFFGGSQSAQLPSLTNAPSSPAASFRSTGTGSSSPSSSGSSISEFLNTAQLSRALLKAHPAARKANATTRKRAACFNDEQVAKFPAATNPFFLNATSAAEPRFETSTKKFAQDSSKSPEFALPSIGTSTTCTDAQLNAILVAMCKFSPEQFQGLMNSMPIIPGTPIGNLDAQGTSLTSSTAMGPMFNAGAPVTNWTGGNGGKTPGFGFAPLSGPGFFSSITLPNAASISISGTLPAPSQLIPTNWTHIFGPPLIMPLSPYDTHPNQFPTWKELEKYCQFLLEARIQADLHRLGKIQKKGYTTETYHQLFSEARRNEVECRLYQDPTIVIPRTLFNSKNSQHMPQTVHIGITDPGSIFHQYKKAQGVIRTKDLWKNLEKKNPVVYHSWCKKAIEIDQEQLKQLVKGFVCKGTSHFSARRNNWLNEQD